MKQVMKPRRLYIMIESLTNARVKSLRRARNKIALIGDAEVPVQKIHVIKPDKTSDKNSKERR